jgi:hypothetical protein
MNVKDKIAKKIKERSVQKVTILGDLEVYCKKHSIARMDSLFNTESKDELDRGKEILGAMADQFLDIETREPLFTSDQIMNDLPSPDAQELLTIFLKVNGGDASKIGEREKN